MTGQRGKVKRAAAAEAAMGAGVGGKARKRQFAIEYVKDYCGKRAAIRAGYAEKSAAVTAHIMLHQDPEVVQWIVELQQLAIGTDEIVKNRARLELMAMGFVNIGEVATKTDGTGQFDFDQFSDTDKKAITGIKTRTRRHKEGDDFVTTIETELKFDKKGAIDSLAKLNGWTVERIGNPDGSPLAIPPALVIQIAQVGK